MRPNLGFHAGTRPRARRTHAWTFTQSLISVAQTLVALVQTLLPICLCFTRLPLCPLLASFPPPSLGTRAWRCPWDRGCWEVRRWHWSQEEVTQIVWTRWHSEADPCPASTSLSSQAGSSRCYRLKPQSFGFSCRRQLCLYILKQHRSLHCSTSLPAGEQTVTGPSLCHWKNPLSAPLLSLTLPLFICIHLFLFVRWDAFLFHLFRSSFFRVFFARHHQSDFTHSLSASSSAHISLFCLSVSYPSGVVSAFLNWSAHNA